MNSSRGTCGRPSRRRTYNNNNNDGGLEEKGPNQLMKNKLLFEVAQIGKRQKERNWSSAITKKINKVQINTMKILPQQVP